MNKYNSEDYFSVIDKRTGRKIVDCGDELDALYMVSMDPQNRTITKNKFLMGQVVDVIMPKALPTNEIVVNGKTGFLTDLSVDQLSEAVAKLASDSDLRAKMGAAGKEYTMARYGVERLVKDHQDLYLCLLNR